MTRIEWGSPWNGLLEELVRDCPYPSADAEEAEDGPANNGRGSAEEMVSALAYDTDLDTSAFQKPSVV